MKILHLPTSVGGNAWGLATAERKLGLNSTVLYSSSDWLKYPGDIILSENKLKSMRCLKLVIETLKNCRKFDVYHFNFGTSMLDYSKYKLDLVDLPLYRGKKIIVTYNGSDARQKYRWLMQNEDGERYILEERNDRCFPVEIKKKRIQLFAKAGANFFALNPDLMHFLPRDTVFLPYTIANWDGIEPVQKKLNKKITIVHAPTDRYLKGSASIIKAVRSIEKRYPGKVEIKIIEKKPHKEALNIYREADLIIDQVRLGWYGAFSVEAMKMGIPVLAYINKADLHFVPVKMRRDVNEAFPDINEFNIARIISEIIENPRRLDEIREAQMEYVWRWHDPIKVARIVKNVYES